MRAPHWLLSQMAEHWISAWEALELAGSNTALCGRLRAGLVKSRARLLIVEEERHEGAMLPPDFWWADGREALEQDWVSGDFSTWIDDLTKWQAFGVTFGLSSTLEMLPFERRGVVAHSLSVAGNANWISAKAARHFAYDRAGVNPAKAGTALIHQARLGFLAARAVRAEAFRGDRNEVQSSWERREWDIPLWFWESFTAEGSSSQDWELGQFSGRGRSPEGLRWITLTGVYFLRESLNVLAPTSSEAASAENPLLKNRPPLAEALLKAWWEKKARIREFLSEAELLVMVRSAYPDNHVARDRMRDLMGPRKTGPK